MNRKLAETQNEGVYASKRLGFGSFASKITQNGLPKIRQISDGFWEARRQQRELSEKCHFWQCLPHFDEALSLYIYIYVFFFSFLMICREKGRLSGRMGEDGA